MDCISRLKKRIKKYKKSFRSKKKNCNVRPTAKKLDDIEREYNISWERILHDRDTFVRFRVFVYQKLANENLAFFIATELYARTRDSAARVSLARYIIGEWIDVNVAEEPINISREERLAIMDNLEKGRPDLFKEAKDSIVKMLRYDLFVEFVDEEKRALAQGDDWVPMQTPVRAIERSQTLENFDTLHAMVLAPFSESYKETVHTEPFDDKPEHSPPRDG